VVLFGFPTWLVAGLALGVTFAFLITVVFVAAERLFPDDDGPRRRRPQRGEQMRREEIGYYLDAIDEPYEVDARVEGHDVSFFLPDRDVAVTFDARAYLSLRDSNVYAILVEHEMPGVHLGNRLPFETPSVGPDSGTTAAGVGGVGRGGATARGSAWRSSSGADPDEIRTSFAVLGLAPGASWDEVRSAYRQRVKEVHPDHGGDEESFHRVQEAYATASEHAD
jgi:hypothetical protein